MFNQIIEMIYVINSHFRKKVATLIDVKVNNFVSDHNFVHVVPFMKCLNALKCFKMAFWKKWQP